MVRVTLFFCALIATVSLADNLAEAQDKSATSQFPRDFVKGVQLGKAAGQSKSAGAVSTPSASASSISAPKKVPRFSKPLETPSAEQMAQALDKFESNFIPIKGIGAILWAGDFTHFSQSLMDFTEVALKHQLPVSEVVVVAPAPMMMPVMMYLNVGPITGVLADRVKPLLEVPGLVDRVEKEAPGLIDKIIALEQQRSRQTVVNEISNEEKVKRFARFEDRWRIVPWLPDQYAFLELSPAYVIQTEYGNLILEASDKPLTSYFNKDGLFDIGPYRMFHGRTEVSVKAEGSLR